MDNPGFDLLKETFKKFAAKYHWDDLASRAARSLATGGKEVVRHGMTEFPKTFIGQMAKDFYDLLLSQDTADGISTIVRSLDEEKIQQAVEKMANSLRDPDTALKIAKELKALLDKAPADQLVAQLDGLIGMSNLPIGGKMIISAVLDQARPYLEAIKDSDEEDVARMIIGFADSIPGDWIAAQVAAVTSQITPESVSRQAHNLVGRVPSPEAVADIAHSVGKSAEEHLDQASKISSVSEIPGIVKNFVQEGADIVSDKISQDNRPKKNFKKGGGNFDL